MHLPAATCTSGVGPTIVTWLFTAANHQPLQFSSLHPHSTQILCSYVAIGHQMQQTTTAPTMQTLCTPCRRFMHKDLPSPSVQTAVLSSWQAVSYMHHIMQLYAYPSLLLERCSPEHLCNCGSKGNHTVYNPTGLQQPRVKDNLNTSHHLCSRQPCLQESDAAMQHSTIKGKLAKKASSVPACSLCNMHHTVPCPCIIKNRQPGPSQAAAKVPVGAATSPESCGIERHLFCIVTGHCRTSCHGSWQSAGLQQCHLKQLLECMVRQVQGSCQQQQP
jgi:hypothetical protein